MKKIAYIAYTFLMLTACNQVTKNNPHAGDGNGKQKAADTTVHYIQEKHLTNVYNSLLVEITQKHISVSAAKWLYFKAITQPGI